MKETIFILMLFVAWALISLIVDGVLTLLNKWWRFRAKPGDYCYYKDMHGKQFWYEIVSVNQGIAKLRTLDEPQTDCMLAMLQLRKY